MIFESEFCLTDFIDDLLTIAMQQKDVEWYEFEILSYFVRYDFQKGAFYIYSIEIKFSEVQQHFIDGLVSLFEYVSASVFYLFIVEMGSYCNLGSCFLVLIQNGQQWFTKAY